MVVLAVIRLSGSPTVEIVELAANATTEVFDIKLPKSRTAEKEAVIMATSLRFLDAQGSQSPILARCTNWPQPYRYLDMPTPDLSILVRQDKVFVKPNNVPVKGLAFYADDVDKVQLEDNLVDLVPGDEQIIVAQGLGGGSVRFMYCGMQGSAVGKTSNLGGPGYRL